jgi:hypothetical protein
MKTKYLLILLLSLFYSISATAQSFAINTDGSTANTSALLDVKSSTKGILIPRLSTSQRTSISSPAEGLLVYDSTANSFWLFDGTAWQEIVAGNNTLWKKNANDIYNTNSGKVGIGTNSPKALLNVKAGAILFDSTIGNTPVSGAGTRMMWIPAKKAFRAGWIVGAPGTQWDDINIGDASYAMGVNAIASGYSSFSFGNTTTASGYYSTALGNQTTASGLNVSTAMGILSTATGNFGSTAIGYLAHASGDYAATAIGYGCVASGDSGTVAMGYGSTADGKTSLAAGNFARAYGKYSIALGDSAVSSGIASFATGYHTNAAGNYAVAMGFNTKATATGSTAIGNTSTASGSGSIVLGIGLTANGSNSVAVGNSNISSGNNSFASGYFTKAKSFSCFTTGIFNDSTNAPNPFALNGSNRIFEIGNGTADNARSNSMTVLFNGNTGIGVLNPKHNLVVANEICVDDNDLNDGDTSNALRFGAYYTGESIGSKRTSGGNHWGLDFITNYVNRMVITNGGNVGIGVYSPARKLSVATDIAVDENNTNNGTISSSLHFGAGNSGEAIASNRFSGNLWGLDFYTNSVNRLSISNSGNVGIGTIAPAATLDVNGTTTTNGLQVSNGTVFTKMQSGSVTVGSSGTSQLTYTITFPVAFTSATPRVFATARNEPSTSYNDAFSVSIRSVSATAVTLNIQRTDTNGFWAQQLRVDWFAVE